MFARPCCVVVAPAQPVREILRTDKFAVPASALLSGILMVHANVRQACGPADTLDHVTCEEEAVYDQRDAESFIRLNALRLRLTADYAFACPPSKPP